MAYTDDLLYTFGVLYIINQFDQQKALHGSGRNANGVMSGTPIMESFLLVKISKKYE